jgi:hypothetical protein
MSGATGRAWSAAQEVPGASAFAAAGRGVRAAEAALRGAAEALTAVHANQVRDHNGDNSDCDPRDHLRLRSAERRCRRRRSSGSSRERRCLRVREKFVKSRSTLARHIASRSG